MKKIIKNDKLKNLLEEKGKIVVEGRELNVEIEKKAEPIVTEYLLEKGIKENGKSEQGFGDGSTTYNLYTGTYNQLQAAFSEKSNNELQQIIEMELNDDLMALKSKELIVNDLNEKISDGVKEIVSELELGEFEEPTTIDLVGEDIEITIIDRLEEYKKTYLELKEKRNATS